MTPAEKHHLGIVGIGLTLLGALAAYVFSGRTLVQNNIDVGLLSAGLLAVVIAMIRSALALTTQSKRDRHEPTIPPAAKRRST